MLAGSQADVAIGLVVCLISGVLSNLGLLLMKLVVTVSENDLVEAVTPSEEGAYDAEAMGEVDDDGSHLLWQRHRPMMRRTTSSSFFDDFTVTKDASVEVLSRANLKWGLGLVLYTIGQALNLVALSFLEQVIWAVLSLSSLVANAIFAHLLLDEHMTLVDLACTALILLGSALVVIANSSAVSNAAAPSVEDLLAHFSRPWFAIYASLLAALLLGCALHAMRSLGRGHRVHALTWTILSATCGSVSVLLGKCIVQVVGIVYHNHEVKAVMTAPSTYIVLAIFIMAALGALVSLNMALAVGEALLVVPWLTVANTMLAILGGILYFEEFQVLEAAGSATLFASGVLLAFGGEGGLIIVLAELMADLLSNVLENVVDE
ncbi:Hypothetical Protein FCC1311_002792 [Hondaea fermentalgiana]|uniref:Magnesium transporter NIPA2 n=1 Tax=Hondaea fermentalgiana TaxID=2315210 RepID=A0A2R5G7Q0_9STRA|nr:Hypothetical Protein FCC1311_002792 [Hondaea fermentalgiana]|eukprot:GBG24061.1 Hypothetical Protein FCC1311_002792 [Hondaea fermentalgiana]